MSDDQIEALDEVPLGPVDFVVIEFPDAKFTGEGLPILLDLVAKGVIRVLDAVVIKANEDGSFVSLSVQDLDATGGAWEVISGWSSGTLKQEDFDEVGAVLAPGSAAAVIVYENSWAGPFAAAMTRAGGRLVAFDRIPVADLMAALEAATETSLEA
jgi:hypothetical protein